LALLRGWQGAVPAALGIQASGIFSAVWAKTPNLAACLSPYSFLGRPQEVKALLKGPDITVEQVAQPPGHLFNGCVEKSR